MATWIAMLRGINVSGARKLPMQELRELFASLGCGHVRTYIQSGNVVFDGVRSDMNAFARKVEEAIADKYDYDVPVVVRSLDEIKGIAAANPYLSRKGVDVGKLHVTFLAEAPTKPNAAAIQGLAFGNDSFELTGREVYVHCPDGYGSTKLNNTFFENKLKVKCTTRNWRTVNELVRMGGEA